jgi:hypothetical protein
MQKHKILLEMPRELWEIVRRLAMDDNRSLNNWIVRELTRIVEQTINKGREDNEN